MSPCLNVAMQKDRIDYTPPPSYSCTCVTDHAAVTLLWSNVAKNTVRYSRTPVDSSH
ncbi:hypothetical protein GJ744_000815 [Endocarpon pusillum]|uniref:Uncharacterized protein n=1 Tax=Endocarpon pusillum TaxID=364733 RepID=A0A8H7AS58_9EURO|nr:hypothetical protein GJ744_000815 [Endocarpon pusillum]